MSPGRPTHAEEFVPIEVSVDAADAEPDVETDTRIDILVESEAYPTARLDDGRYVAAGSSGAGASVSNHQAT